MNPSKRSLLILLIALNMANSFSQEDVVIGKKYVVTSNILSQDRAIHVYLPDSYETSKQKYPVLFILDGQWHFTNGVAIQKSLRVPDRIPEMIVIGVQNKNPLRRRLFGVDSEKFYAFLEKELIPYIDNNFRTSNDRILFGWEAGAFFSCNALFKKKRLFNAAIITNGAYANEEMIADFNQAETTDKTYLFIANSLRDIYYIQGSEELSNLLHKTAPENLIWTYEKFNDEIHESLAYRALYSGLKYYYHNYGSLVFTSISEYDDLGGLDYLKNYFKERSKRFDFSPQIDDSTKNSLIWLAWNLDNFDAFTTFMKEFVDVLSTNRYASGYWQNRFAQFYLKHHDLNNAIQYFHSGISTYPEAPQAAAMYNGLGQAYMRRGDKKNAKRNFKKAIAIAKKNADTDLEYYKEQLQVLN